MADQKVSDLPALSGADVDAADLLYIVDSSAGSAGSKKITVGQYQLAPVSGGTANGVMYLDGSKVVTTGSDLVFDGTNLGVGTSLPGTRLHVYSTSARQITSGNASSTWTFGASGATFAFKENSAGAEQLVLDSFGNLGLGVPPSAWNANFKAIEVLNGSVANSSSNTIRVINNAVFGSLSTTYKASDYASYYMQYLGQHQWYTAPSGTAGQVINNPGGAAPAWNQAMALDASGNLLVGQTSGGVKNSNSFGLDVSGGGYLTISHINGSASGTRYEYYGYNGAEIGSVTQNGTTGVLFNTTSDRRLKDNITPAPSASAAIDAIEIVSHDWKAAPDEHVTYGVIAQDLALVAPQAVLQGDDGDVIEKPWGVDYSKLVPMLIKEIQTLRARVAALESA